VCGATERQRWAKRKKKSETLACPWARDCHTWRFASVLLVRCEIWARRSFGGLTRAGVPCRCGDELRFEVDVFQHSVSTSHVKPPTAAGLGSQHCLKDRPRYLDSWYQPWYAWQSCSQESQAFLSDACFVLSFCRSLGMRVAAVDETMTQLRQGKHCQRL
jgi:hypothetical protein